MESPQSEQTEHGVLFDVLLPPGDDSTVRWIRVCIFSALVLIAPAIARAQATEPSRDPLRVFLVTFGPGSDPWEKFGHDAIAIEDTDAGTSVIYNWGVFDFGQGFSGIVTFGWHFLQGRLLYSMRSADTDGMLDFYKSCGRSILVQELGLTASQKLNLKTNLEANDTEANRYYLYDYFQKNCTTMARDAIDGVIGGRIAATLKPVTTRTTLRWHDRRLSADQLWLYIFLDYALGHPVDRPLSAWQECFLPAKLALHLQSVQVPRGDGTMGPLVIWQKQLATGIYTERAEPPASFFYGFLAAGICIGAAFVGLAIAGSRFRVVRWLFNLGVMLWSVPAGALGLMLSYAWFSNHEAAKWNENWLQGNVVSLLLIVLAPMAYRWPTTARRVAFLVLGFSAFGLVAKITPWFWQVNGSIIALALPIHAGVAWGIWRVTKKVVVVEISGKAPAAEPLGSALAQQG